MIRLMNCSLLFLCVLHGLSAYQIPDPSFKIYRTGFDVSIPHEDGIQFFFFTGNLNSVIGSRDMGIFFDYVFQRDETGLWTFKNSNTKLNLGDTINYYVIVTKDGCKHFSDVMWYTVTYYEETAISDYRIPDLSFRVYVKGFEASIPYEDGIQFFVFSANLNLELQDYEYGEILDDVQQPDENGLLTYKNADAELKLGDVLHYWVRVIKNGMDYYKGNLVHVVGNHIEYTIPKPTIQIYSKGFTVSIPHEYGIEIVDFAASVNSAIKWPFVGMWGNIFAKPDANGYWTYKNSVAELQLGDVLYYYIVVVKNGKCYYLDHCSYTEKNKNQF